MTSPTAIIAFWFHAQIGKYIDLEGFWAQLFETGTITNQSQIYRSRRILSTFIWNWKNNISKLNHQKSGRLTQPKSSMHKIVKQTHNWNIFAKHKHIRDDNLQFSLFQHGVRPTFLIDLSFAVPKKKQIGTTNTAKRKSLAIQHTTYMLVPTKDVYSNFVYTQPTSKLLMAPLLELQKFGLI